MLKPAFIREQATKAFENYAANGIELFEAEYKAVPVISHVCFKFSDQMAYQEYIETAEMLGKIRSEMFNNKEITWCKLHQPIVKDDLVVEWLEMVEPKVENNAFDGVTSIGYIATNISETIKLPSGNKDVLFRFQSEDVRPLLN